MRKTKIDEKECISFCYETPMILCVSYKMHNVLCDSKGSDIEDVGEETDDIFGN